MFNSLSHRDKIAVIGVFSVALFSMATVAYQEKTIPIEASEVVQTDLSNVNPTKRLAVASNEEVSTPSEPSVTLAGETGLTAQPISNLTLNSTPLIQTTDKAPAKPFYTDWRYMLVIANGIILFILIVVLTIRLILRLFTQPGMQEPIDFTKQSTGPVTADQLDIDIPL